MLGLYLSYLEINGIDYKVQCRPNNKFYINKCFVHRSFEEIEPLEDFKCYVTGGNTAKTVLHDEAKDLYRMIIDSDLLDEEEETDKVSDHSTLLFYNSEETYPEATVPEEDFYGVYRIYESGLVRYTASPDSTFLFRYMTPADLYSEIYFYLNA